MKVSIAFCVADFFHAALYAHHTLEFNPVKLQSCKRIACQLLAFAAVVVGVPNNAALVVAFDQNHTRAGAHVAGHSGHGHGIGLGHF